ncbi:MAG: VWA domain-containing protein [Deferribacteres bacterium]|nr:VWA domain-containing protein [Deferribacteres bacterium]
MSVKSSEKEAAAGGFLTAGFSLLVFCVAACVLFFAPRTSHAAGNSGMDVVLVMDSSGSMKKTDPLFLRIPAAKMFISLLSADDRAGLISFSDRSYPVSYLTPLDSEGNKAALLSATDRITSRGLYTNLYDALKGGLDVLSMDGNTERPGVIILMSDGMMDTGDPDEDRRLVGRIENELAGVLRDRNVRVFTIAFTEQSDVDLLRRISKRTGGFFNLALTDKDFHLIFTSIFESLKGPDMLPVTKNGFFIDGSIEEVTIIANKGSPDTKIRLNSPDGQSYTYNKKKEGADIKWFVSNNFDMITIKNPAEGRWEILFSTGENNKVYVITDLSLRTNFDQLYVAYGEPADIDIWLEKDGQPITEEDILEKIDFYIELTTPDGNTMKLKPFNRGNGVFQRRIASFNEGDYMLRIVAKGMTFERQKVFVFNVPGPKEALDEPPPAVTSGEDMQEEPDKAAVEMQPEDGITKERETEEVSWKTVIARFLIINIVLCIAGVVYFKRRDLKGLMSLSALERVRGFILRGKEKKDTENGAREKSAAERAVQARAEKEKEEAAGDGQEEGADNEEVNQAEEAKQEQEVGDVRNKIALEEDEAADKGADKDKQQAVQEETKETEETEAEEPAVEAEAQKKKIVLEEVKEEEADGAQG